MSVRREIVDDLDEARTALDVLERAGGEIVHALDAGDLTAADAAIDAREGALTALGASMERITGAWRQRGGPRGAEVTLAREIEARVSRAAEEGVHLTRAVERAQGRAHDGLRRVRCGSRLAEHQRARGQRTAGGWLDARR